MDSVWTNRTRYVSDADSDTNSDADPYSNTNSNARRYYFSKRNKGGDDY